MRYGEAISALRREVEQRGWLLVTDATAKLIGVGVHPDEVASLLSDGVGSQWGVQRSAEGLLLVPLVRTDRAFPWELTPADLESCWRCGWTPALKRNGTRLCLDCWAVVGGG